MQTANIRRSIIRLTGIVVVATGLVMSSGVAGATPPQVGLTECHMDTCAVVSVGEVKAARAERILAIYRRLHLPTDRRSPHFIP